MWEKLSTVSLPSTRWQQALGRGLRKGELNVIAASRRTGKSTLTKQMWDILNETETERQYNEIVKELMQTARAIDTVSGDTKDE